MYDVKLTSDYDISIDANGDIKTEDAFNTAILMSLFCERRASASEMPDALRRRGWIGNTDDFEIGSKLWLYEQARKSTATDLNINAEVLNALSWFVEDNLLESINATTKDGVIEVTLSRPTSQVEKRYYKLWSNSGGVSTSG